MKDDEQVTGPLCEHRNATQQYRSCCANRAHLVEDSAILSQYGQYDRSFGTLAHEKDNTSCCKPHPVLCRCYWRIYCVIELDRSPVLDFIRENSLTSYGGHTLNSSISLEIFAASLISEIKVKWGIEFFNWGMWEGSKVPLCQLCFFAGKKAEFNVGPENCLVNRILQSGFADRWRT